MNPNALTDLVLTGAHYQRSRGQTIQPYDTDGHINLLESGYVKRYLVSKDGSLSVQGIFGPGQIFPLVTVHQKLFDQTFTQGSVQYFYGAITDVSYYSISPNKLVEAAAINPLLYKHLLEQAGNRLRSNSQLIENMSFRSAFRRVAHQLVYLGKYFGEESPEGLVVKVPLTQQDLSEILNLSRETVSREMAKLKDRDILAHGQKLVILDLERLEAIYK